MLLKLEASIWFWNYICWRILQNLKRTSDLKLIYLLLFRSHSPKWPAQSARKRVITEQHAPRPLLPSQEPRGRAKQSKQQVPRKRQSRRSQRNRRRYLLLIQAFLYNAYVNKSALFHRRGSLFGPHEVNRHGRSLANVAEGLGFVALSKAQKPSEPTCRPKGIEIGWTTPGCLGWLAVRTTSESLPATTHN